MKPHEFTEKIIAFLGTMGVKVTKPKFYVEINLDAAGKPSMVYSSDTDTVFRIVIYPSEWSVMTLKRKKESHVRVYADTGPQIVSDALGLFTKTPSIDQIPTYLRNAEKKLAVAFPRVAYVRTNLPGGKKAIAAWLETL